ncbi:MAG TPA: hypothetical protein VGI06_15800 [Acidimicrobiales bacterium]
MILLVAAVAVAGIEWRHDAALSRTAARERAVRTTAGELAQALLSYNATNLDASRARVLALSTATFAANYNQDFTQALAGTITALHASASATVRDVYTADVSASAAKAIVVVDFQTKSSAGTRQVLGTSLQMDLVRQGTWKVNDVSVVSAQSETQTPTTTPKP